MVLNYGFSLSKTLYSICLLPYQLLKEL